MADIVIVLTTLHCKRLDSRGDSINILVTGPSGCGKTTLVEKMSEGTALDMDLFGHYEPYRWKSDMAYIVRSTVIQYLIDQSNDLALYCGNCSNIMDRVDTMTSGRLGRADSPHTQEPIVGLEWDRKIFLWYEPSEVELNARFGNDRENNYGKDPVTRREIVNYLEATRLGVADFEFINVTGIREITDLLRKMGLTADEFTEMEE